MDKIYIGGMQFYGFHGVMGEETKLGQRFIVNLTLHLPLSHAGETDCVEDTVNYAEVFAVVRDIVEGKPVKLLERLAHTIALQLFDSFTRIQAVDVEIEKPGAPIQGIFDVVTVMVHRTRSDF